MITDVEYAELHTPIFLAGTNLTAKLDPTKRSGLVLTFDEDKKRLIVGYNKKVAQIPEANVSIFVAGKIADKAVKPVSISGPITAQVSTPQDHVFAGPGGGKTK